MLDIFIVVFSYFVGSVPCGILIVRAFGKGDLRTMGSGNIGATNVMRTQSKKILGVTTFLCDLLKGYVACSIAFTYCVYDLCVVLSAALVVFGHMFPVWSRFIGGKGVATTFGVFLSLTTGIGVAAMFIWLLTFLFFRISSLAGIISVCAAFVMSMFIDYHIENISLIYFVISVIIVIRHKENIIRIMNDKEFSFK